MPNSQAPVRVPLGLISRLIRGFFMIFLLVGLGLTVVGVKLIIEASAAAGWPSAGGIVVASRLEFHVTEGRKNAVPKVVYQYTVNGKQYRGDRICIGDSTGAGRPGASETVEKYKVGKAVQVYYDPGDPASSVLDPSFNPSLFIMVVMGLFFSVMGLAVYKKTKSLAAALQKGLPLPLSAKSGVSSGQSIFRPASAGSDAEYMVPPPIIPLSPTRDTHAEASFGPRGTGSPWTGDDSILPEKPEAPFELPPPERAPAWRKVLTVCGWVIVFLAIILYGIQLGWLKLP